MLFYLREDMKRNMHVEKLNYWKYYIGLLLKENG